MRDHEGCNRGYYLYSREVLFGMYHSDGSTSGEISVEWVNLSGKLVPRLQAFDDSWSALALFSDVIERLSEVDEENITPAEFAGILENCGFNRVNK